MAGTQITTAITQVDEQRKGFQNITLTNWTNVAEPEINQGGRVEIEGALFSFTANEDLDASNNWAGVSNSTQIYGYYLVGGGGTTVTCELTTTAPTWQEEKGGWYDTATDTNRFWGGIYKDAGGNYSNKFIYLGRDLITANHFNVDENSNIELTGTVNLDKNIGFASDADILWDESEDEFYFNKSLKVDDGIETDGTKFKTKKLNTGGWNMDLTAIVSIAHGLVWTNIRSVNVIIRNDANNKWTSLTTLGGNQIDGVWNVDATNINLARINGADYDNNADYDDAANRGHIIIVHEV